MQRSRHLRGPWMSGKNFTWREKRQEDICATRGWGKDFLNLKAKTLRQKQTTNNNNNKNLIIWKLRWGQFGSQIWILAVPSPTNPWACYFTSLCLSFLINKMERIASTNRVLGVWNKLIFIIMLLYLNFILFLFWLYWVFIVVQRLLLLWSMGSVAPQHVRS